MQNRGKTLLGLAVLALASLFAQFAVAQAGQLDTTFGQGGKVTTDFGYLASGQVNGVPFAALEQSDGKIVVMGAITDVPNVATQAIGLVRYQSNGSLDTTFGQNGLALVAFDNYINYGFSMALMSDGRIVVAGEEQSSTGSFDRFGIARFNPNGTLDTTFGGTGMVTTEFFASPQPGVREAAHAVIVQGDGKIVAAGSAQQGGKSQPVFTAIARYNLDGSLDATFGSGGKMMTSAATVGAESLAMLNDGDVLAACGSTSLEITASGAVRSSVLGGSIAATSIGGSETFQADDKYLQTEAFFVNRSTHIVEVVRDLAGGGTDSSYSNPPFNFGNSSGSGSANSIAIQGDGKAVVAGLTNATGSFGVARLTTNGALDSTFGSGGSTTTSFAFSGAGTAVTIQSDGKIVVVGYVMNSSGAADFALVRYLGQ